MKTILVDAIGGLGLSTPRYQLGFSPEVKYWEWPE